MTKTHWQLCKVNGVFQKARPGLSFLHNLVLIQTGNNVKVLLLKGWYSLQRYTVHACLYMSLMPSDQQRELTQASVQEMKHLLALILVTSVRSIDNLLYWCADTGSRTTCYHYSQLTMASSPRPSCRSQLAAGQFAAGQLTAG